MKIGDVVNITEQRGSGIFYEETPLGWGIILDIKKTEDLTIGSVGPINLGDDVTVYLSTGATKNFIDRSLEVIIESR
tara:strand:- start:35 stop:265 length:231 start_codon:yes stop_codon:yes gene_type:complete